MVRHKPLVLANQVWTPGQVTKNFEKNAWFIARWNAARAMLKRNVSHIVKIPETGLHTTLPWFLVQQAHEKPLFSCLLANTFYPNKLTKILFQVRRRSVVCSLLGCRQREKKCRSVSGIGASLLNMGGDLFSLWLILAPNILSPPFKSLLMRLISQAYTNNS